MVFKISVLKFYKMPTGQGSILSICSQLGCMIESSRRTIKNIFARAPLRDSELIELGKS